MKISHTAHLFFYGKFYSKRIKKAERIGEVIKNILFVGDHIDKDIKSALRTGIQAILKAAYTNTGKEPPKEAWKITHLSDLPALIKKINTVASMKGGK